MPPSGVGPCLCVSVLPNYFGLSVCYVCSEQYKVASVGTKPPRILPTHDHYFLLWVSVCVVTDRGGHTPRVGAGPSFTICL